MYSVKSLKRVPISRVIKCYDKTENDTSAHMRLSKTQRIANFYRHSFHPEFSFGAFSGIKLISLLLNAVEEYNGKRTVYNMATRVVAGYDKPALYADLLTVAKQELATKGLDAFVVEVNKADETAIAFYTQHSFTVSQEYAHWFAEDTHASTTEQNIEFLPFSAFYLKRVAHCDIPLPAFAHCTKMLRKNEELYQVAYRKCGEEITAFCIYHIETGSVVQLGYTNTTDMESILIWLLQNHKTISLPKLDVTHTRTTQLLQELQFKKLDCQYEMTCML